jgi:hypothetical protein
MIGELRTVREYVKMLREMEPERARQWLEQERLFDAMMRAVDRLEKAVHREVEKADATLGADDVEELRLDLSPRFSVKDSIGRTPGKLLATWIGHLPLKSGWMVSVGTWSDGKVEIIVHHVACKRTQPYDEVIEAEPLFEGGIATGVGSNIMVRID